jgi:hypothetical protein
VKTVKAQKDVGMLSSIEDSHGLASALICALEVLGHTAAYSSDDIEALLDRGEDIHT